MQVVGISRQSFRPPFDVTAALHLTHVVLRLLDQEEPLWRGQAKQARPGPGWFEPIRGSGHGK